MRYILVGQIMPFCAKIGQKNLVNVLEGACTTERDVTLGMDKERSEVLREDDRREPRKVATRDAARHRVSWIPF